MLARLLQLEGCPGCERKVKLLPLVVENAAPISRHTTVGNIQRRDYQDFEEALLRPALVALCTLEDVWMACRGP
jgi:hypothetical protein